MYKFQLFLKKIWKKIGKAHLSPHQPCFFPMSRTQSMAFRYPASPRPYICLSHTGAVTDTFRNSSRFVMSEMWISTFGTVMLARASRMA